ncbi:MAG: methyltransferase domain-containing protein [Candidatus Marsarchaeota archaeon]|jgi:tRNA (adenine57-N1/adenine58-N1)-methyltransferase|nr:methyltransferase domain-containing protein [Candidatus Marsarchaeota archaeon]MCL5112034.1 methyltransferase domain-containing protein [Candidatus Marsarchaeota archaeon]
MKGSNDILVPQHFKRLKRGPQVILPKDIGMIIAYTGIGKNSVCVDAGTGSGWLAIAIARIAKEVTTYDNRDEFIRIAERNKEIEGLDNLVIKKGDVMKGIEESEVDLVTLDMPDSDKVLRSARRALKDDGHVVGYLPHTEQVKRFVETLEKLKFRNILTIEAIVRDILVREQGVRPSTKGVWHTGYLVFAQK